MFGLFKGNEKKQLEKKYRQLLEEGMELQRKGDIKGFALKTEEADKIADQIKDLN
jgi:hypothetical protein